MDAQSPFGSQDDSVRRGVFDDEGVERGSAWAALDETFFQIVQDTFTPTYRLGAEILLSANDNEFTHRGFIPEQPAEYEAPEEDDEPESEADAEARAAARRAAMRRHPSNWRGLH